MINELNGTSHLMQLGFGAKKWTTIALNSEDIQSASGLIGRGQVPAVLFEDPYHTFYLLHNETVPFEKRPCIYQDALHGAFFVLVSVYKSDYLCQKF
jgi:hypothetical protein